MSDEPNTPSDDSPQPVRSTQGVLIVLGLIVLVPVIALIIAFMPRGSGGGAGANVVDSVNVDKVQAVYLTDGLVYFGIVGDAHGDFFELRKAFYLRTSGTDADKGEDTGGKLVPVPVSSEVGGDGNLRINAREVVRIQTLDDDSQIAKAIDIGT